MLTNPTFYQYKQAKKSIKSDREYFDFHLLSMTLFARFALSTALKFI